MKIIIDKLKSDPDHSLSKKDITTVLKHVPKDWFGPANIFRLTSLIFKKSTWSRIVIYNAPTYFIMSRGFEKK